MTSSKANVTQLLNRPKRFATRMRPYGVLLFLALPVAPSTAHGAQAAGAAPPDVSWPAELTLAVRAYEAGDYAHASVLCDELRRDARDRRVRFHAELLSSFVLLCASTREERLNGQGRLAALAGDDPRVYDRPDVQLALGISQLFEHDTSRALLNLTRAADGFASLRQPARETQALIATAKAWLEHAEWELEGSRFLVPQPPSAESAHELRRAKVAEIRERLVRIGAGDESVARVDLALANYLLERPGSENAGLELLTRLADSSPLSEPAAEAGLTLAERSEAAGAWEDARARIERVMQADIGPLSARAAERLRELQAPQLELTVPRQCAPGERPAVRLRCRNSPAVRFEVSRLDLERWLRQRQGRLSEAALPDDGSVIVLSDLDTQGSRPFDWWDSADASAPLVGELQTGAYVVIARAPSGAGPPIEQRRLLVVSDLRATVVTGTTRAAIWTVQTGPRTAETGTALFWMHGSFVPRVIDLPSEAVCFALPGESRALRDRRWSLLVKRGDELAFCEGELPASARSSTPVVPYLAAAGPPDPRAGDRLYVAGWLAPPIGLAPRNWPGAIDVRLVDALGDPCADVQAPLRPSGGFAATLEIPNSAAGRTLNLSLRAKEAVLAPVFGRLAVPVRPLDEAEFDVAVKLPQQLAPDSRTVAGTILARSAWGAPLSGGAVDNRYRAIRLPTNDPHTSATNAVPWIEDLRLDARGAVNFSRPLEEFELPSGPTAIQVWATVTDVDRRTATDSREVIVGSEALHAWINVIPNQAVAGQPAYVEFGWFDPTARRRPELPRLRVRTGEQETRTLGVTPVWGGAASAPWVPQQSGAHELEATVPLREGAPLVIREPVVVASADRQAVPLVCDARAVFGAGEPRVELTVHGERRSSMLALLEADEPIAAAVVPAGDADFAATLGGGAWFSAGARVLLLEVGTDSVAVAMPVRAEDPPRVIATPAHSSEASPASLELDLRVEASARVNPLDFMVRLERGGDRSTIAWTPGPIRAAMLDQRSPIRVAASSSAPRRADDTMLAASPPASPQMLHAVLSGRTEWLGIVEARDRRARVSIPTPAEPDQYVLHVLARLTDGNWASGALPLDLRDRPAGRLDVPDVLSLGDRSVVTLMIENPAASEREFVLTLDCGEGLAVEALNSSAPLAASELDGTHCKCRGTLPSGSRMYVRARVEAARAGDYRVAAELRSSETAAAWGRDYAVVAMSTGSTVAPDAAARLTRELYKLTRLSPAEAGISQDEPAADASVLWQREPLASGEAVRSGQLMLLVERLDCPRELAGVQWRQALPPTARTYGAPTPEFRALGTDTVRRLHLIEYSGVSLPAGPLLHELVVVAGRPGAGAVPPPQLRVGDREVPVLCEPSSLLLIVRDEGFADSATP
ncbi:MAG: hypothetical protein HRF50_11905 [Phycisphaerae bacterium]|jgi:hypothetical protein